MVVGFFTQDPEVRLHPEGLRQAPRHDKPLNEDIFKILKPVIIFFIEFV